MNANPKFLAATAQVDDAAVQPLPNSRKIYVEGRAPTCACRCARSARRTRRHRSAARRTRRSRLRHLRALHRSGGEDRYPLRPAAAARAMDRRSAATRSARGPTSGFGTSGSNDPKLAELRFNLKAQSAARASGAQRHADALRAPRHHHAGDGVHRHPRKPAARRYRRLQAPAAGQDAADADAAPRASLRRGDSRTSSRRSSCATKSRAAARSSRPTSITRKPSR